MPDVHEIGQVSDIDGLAIRICTEGDRVRLEVGSSVAVLDKDGCQDFALMFVRASWEAAGPSRGEPSW